MSAPIDGALDAALGQGVELVVDAPDAVSMALVGEALATVLRAGDTVLLGGDLGAGKTTLTKGLASALGVAGPVTSPTFVLVHSYRTDRGFDLLHADVWRLEQLQEAIDLAIPELVEDGAAAVVEWGERAAPALDRECLRVVVDYSPVSPAPRGEEAGPGAEGPREVYIAPAGQSWAGRIGALRHALAARGLVMHPVGGGGEGGAR